jgi:hypothetical protein
MWHCPRSSRSRRRIDAIFDLERTIDGVPHEQRRTVRHDKKSIRALGSPTCGHALPTIRCPVSSNSCLGNVAAELVILSICAISSFAGCSTCSTSASP